MARGSSNASSRTPMKVDSSSTLNVPATKTVKFRTTSPESCSRKLRYSQIKMATKSNSCVVGIKTRFSKQNNSSSHASDATNAHHDNKSKNRINVEAFPASSQTRSRDGQNATTTPINYLTSNKTNVITSSNNEYSTYSRARNRITRCRNNPSTISNKNSPISKRNIVSTHRKTDLSRNKGCITHSIDEKTENTITSNNILSKKESSPIPISCSNNIISTHSNVALTNNNNSLPSDECSNSVCETSVNVIPITIEPTAESSECADNERIHSNPPMHLSFSEMSLAKQEDLQNDIEEQKQTLGGRGSPDVSAVEANSPLPGSATDIDEPEGNYVPEDVTANISATHMLSAVQCVSQADSPVLQNNNGTTTDECATLQSANDDSNSVEVIPTRTDDSASLLHQHRRQETCLHCGSVVEFLLSHLVHSRRCQTSYDLDTLEQVARRRSSGSSTTTTPLLQTSSQTMDSIPPVGASVEVANDTMSHLEDDNVDAATRAVDDFCGGNSVSSSDHQSYADLDSRGTEDVNGLSEPYILCEDSKEIAEGNVLFTNLRNDNLSEHQWPVRVASRIVARKVKELSKASLMANKVLKTSACQPNQNTELVNLVRLHSKGGVPIVMRKRKKTIQEEIEEEELEELRRRPVITARIPANSRLYNYRRARGLSSASEEDGNECEQRRCYIGTAVRRRKLVSRLQDSYNLSKVPFSESEQIIGQSVETHLHHTSKGVWNSELLVMQQKLQDFQKRLKVCERLSQTSLPEGEEDACENKQHGTDDETLGNNTNYDDCNATEDRLLGSLSEQHNVEEGGDDIFAATEDWFIPEKLQSDQWKRRDHQDARMDSKFGVKKKIVASHPFRKELPETTDRGLSINNNNNNIIDTLSGISGNNNNNEDVEDMPDYFDDEFLRQHFQMRSHEVQQQTPPAPSSPAPRGRLIHIKRTQCKSCGAKIKYILSHLSKSFKCQALYDMTLLRAQSEQNKKLRQRHYERQHKSIIKERQRQYYHNKRETLRNKKKLYYQQNRDALRERQGQYYDRNYDRQREKKRLYYIQNSERLREQHRRYNAVFRQREWNRRLQLDLLHYRREMVDRGEDPDSSEQVVEMTQHIMALPTDIEAIKRAMTAAGNNPPADDTNKGKVVIDNWRRGARAWVGGRRVQGARKEGPSDAMMLPPQASTSKRSVARVKRLGDSKVIKLTKAGDATGNKLNEDSPYGNTEGDYDFMMAADQVIIEAVGDLELGEEIQHDIEYVAADRGDAAQVEEIHIQEEESHPGPDGDGGCHRSEDEVARVGQVQTEIHEDFNHVSFVQTLTEGASFHLHDDEDVVNHCNDRKVSGRLNRKPSVKRRRVDRNSNNQSRRAAAKTSKRGSFIQPCETGHDNNQLNDTVTLDECEEERYISSEDDEHVTINSGMVEPVLPPYHRRS